MKYREGRVRWEAQATLCYKHNHLDAFLRMDEYPVFTPNTTFIGVCRPLPLVYLSLVARLVVFVAGMRRREAVPTPSSDPPLLDETEQEEVVRELEAAADAQARCS